MSDRYLYTEQDLQTYLPVVWGYDPRLPEGMERPDHDMPSAQSDPRATSNRWTVSADVKRAWERANLTKRQRQVIFLRYGTDDIFQDIAHTLGVKDHKTVLEHHDKGIAGLLEFLNGRPRLKVIK